MKTVLSDILMANTSKYYIDTIFARADKVILAVLCGMQIFSFALADWYGTWMLSFLIGLPVLFISIALVYAKPGQLMTRLFNGCAVMIYCALHIHQSMGMTEIHFGIFAFLAFLVIYGDWRVILAAAVVVAAHHFSFNYLQELGVGVFCFTKPSWLILFTHAAYVVVEAIVLSYISFMIYKGRAQEGELMDYTKALNGNQGRVNLRDHNTHPASESGMVLQQVIVTLHDAVRHVKEGVDSIVIASSEIATGNSDLSRRTEAQASSLQEAASSMSQLTHSVKMNADNAYHANELVISASDIASKGNDMVGQVVTTMGSIKDSSRKIVDIISVIDGIAFQTNILALNAAVEAARAGEQGRGFAVVASEVRNLAQRSASAAKEIKALIDDSVDKVEQGSQLVDKAGQTMENIMLSVKKVADIMHEIAQASQEQRGGIEQISLVVSDMDEMTQQNAALVEEAAAAAESMSEQAEKLEGVVRLFVIAEGSADNVQQPQNRHSQARIYTTSGTQIQQIR